MIVKTDGLFAALHNTNTHFVLLSPPRVWEVQRGDPEVDEAARQPAPVHRLRHQPSHQVLTAARPAVEAEDKKSVICSLTECPPCVLPHDQRFAVGVSGQVAPHGPGDQLPGEVLPHQLPRQQLLQLAAVSWPPARAAALHLDTGLLITQIFSWVLPPAGTPAP